MAPDGEDTPLVRIVRGTGTGPTAVAAYDAALADAGVHDYNLLTVSSVVPADAAVAAVDTAPDLGPGGNQLTVVQSKATVEGPGRATAGIGWTTGDGPGVIYEAAGEFDEAVARRLLRDGLSAARDLRDRSFADEEAMVSTTLVEGGGFGAAVALAIFGESEPIL